MSEAIRLTFRFLFAHPEVSTSLVVLVLVILGLLIAAVIWRRRLGLHERRTERIPCPRCGYDLTGLTVPRCPECGALRGFRKTAAELGLDEADLAAAARRRAARGGAPGDQRAPDDSPIQ